METPGSIEWDWGCRLAFQSGMSGPAFAEGPPPLPESQGPWSQPPTQPPSAKPATSTASPTPEPTTERPPRRVPVGLIVWLALICGAIGAYVAFTLVFPGQTSGMDQADALRLLGLLALVSTGLVFMRRVREAVRNIAIWAGIAGVLLVGYTYRNDLLGIWNKVSSEVLPSVAVANTPHSMTISASQDGGFYVQGKVNGAPVRFAIDTGASGIVLSPADAQRAGVDVSKLDFSASSETATGVGQIAPSTATSLEVGPLQIGAAKVAVDRTPMIASLLGMDFLRRFDSIEIKGDQLTLTWRG